MFMVFKKKKLIILSVCILLGLSTYLGFDKLHFETADNSTQNTEEQLNADLLPGEAVSVSSDNYFLESKNDRELLRSKSTELLRSIIDNENTSEETKKEAESKLLNVARDIDNELKIENLLKAKGYNECMVFISDDSVTVTLDKENIKNEDIAKINDIVYEITGNNTIKIVEVR